MHPQHVVIAVYGNEKLGFYLPVNPRRFLAVAVAGRVHVARVVGDDVRSLPRKIIFQFLHGALVSGNYRRRENDCVRRLEADVFVSFVADARERGEFVSLRSGRQNNQILLRILLHVFHRDDRIVSVFYDADFPRNLYVRAH